MKVKTVSALRSKRGLHRMNGAEPQVVGLTPQTTNEWKANTMRTYILRAAKPVEPQKSIRCAPGCPARSHPAVPRQGRARAGPAQTSVRALVGQASRLSCLSLHAGLAQTSSARLSRKSGAHD